MPTFTPPHGSYGNVEPATRLEMWFGRIDRGLTVLKKDGVYTVVDFPYQGDCDDADICYLGGHVYEVSNEEADALTAADLGDGVNRDTWDAYATYLWGSLQTWIAP